MERGEFQCHLARHVRKMMMAMVGVAVEAATDILMALIQLDGHLMLERSVIKVIIWDRFSYARLLYPKIICSHMLLMQHVP